MIEIILFYVLALIALVIGIAVVPMTFKESTPIKVFYLHYFVRKPIIWMILIVLTSWTLIVYTQQNEFPFYSIIPLVITSIALILTYKLHPESAFKAVDYPEFTEDISGLPIDNDKEIAVIEYNGITKCYPLDYVVHHHIVNDNFGSKIVALTYCAMCRSVIPFDVTEIGPLFVTALKNGNMVVADRKTKTFFQQSTFQSLIGKLHPSELTMIPFQVLSWADVKKTISNPFVVKVSKKDFRAFELPIPGVWSKVIAGETVPGVSKKNRDTTFPARTRIIGITDKSISEKLVYLRTEVKEKNVVLNDEYGFFLIKNNDIVNAYRSSINNSKLSISFSNDLIIDGKSGTKWDIRGKYISGKINTNLEPIMISDEYWFSWKKFQGKSRLIRH
ncbi:MAG: DUF3179 domain-containing (seleno)protein [Flavobacteriaceae bacterium]